MWRLFLIRCELIILELSTCDWTITGMTRNKDWSSFHTHGTARSKGASSVHRVSLWDTLVTSGSLITNQVKVDTVKSIVTFCVAQYYIDTKGSRVNICICIHLYSDSIASALNVVQVWWFLAQTESTIWQQKKKGNKLGKLLNILWFLLNFNLITSGPIDITLRYQIWAPISRFALLPGLYFVRLKCMHVETAVFWRKMLNIDTNNQQY